MRWLVPGVFGVVSALLGPPSDESDRKARDGEAGALTARIERELELREYEATPNGDGLQAPNRAHGLRTYFEPTGIRVLDRTAAGSPELLAMTLSGVGRGGALAEVVPGQVSHRGARVEIRRPGLTEWYENRAEGLEQGFDVEKRFAGDGPLVVELAVTGADVALDGDALVLRASTGRRLRYAGLHAEDAQGSPLPARLELAASGRVRLVVDDASAEYPIAIDPLLTQSPDTLLQGNQDAASLFSWFGSSVASAGDVNGDGYADLIVGAQGYDTGVLGSGAAFVFSGGPGGIASGGPNLAATVLTSQQSFAIFGFSVATAGDVNGDGYADVIVGAPGYDAGESEEGAAFIFLGGPLGVEDGTPGTAATVIQGNQASVSGVGGWLGERVATAGDVNGDGYADVLVGSRSYNDAGTPTATAFVYLGSASGVASGGPINAATRLTRTFFNVAATLSESPWAASAGDVNGDGYDDVIVGDAQYAPSGGAFVFLGGASGIVDASTETASTRITSTSAASFGQSVAPAGDLNGDGYGDVIVGSGTLSSAGAASIYLGGPSGIAHGTELTASSTLTSSVSGTFFGGNFGAADFNCDGYSDVAVGAVSHPAGGAAFVFLGSASSITTATQTSAWAMLASPVGNTGGFPRSLGAGDVNGDGCADLVAANYRYTGPEPEEGAVWVYLGGASRVSSSPNGDVVPNQGAARLGTTVASAGDVNGDGFADLIVGAPLYDAGENDEGAAFVFHGSAAGIASGTPPLGTPQNANTTLQSDEPNAALGTSVAVAGDVNGDGYSDVIVGAPKYGTPDAGSAFVFLGSASGVASVAAPTAHAHFDSPQAAAELGASVASAGDVNGDGVSDVILGAPNYGASEMGAAFVFHGGPPGLASGSVTTAAATIQATDPHWKLGASVASAGDFDGDGYGDVIIGAPAASELGPDSGVALIFRGSASGIAGGGPANASTTIGTMEPFAHLGASVSGAGDVNGDGFDDVIVGAPEFEGNGAAFVFAGSANLEPFFIPDLALIQIASLGTLELGSSVAAAGDANGDGFADVIVGAPDMGGIGAAVLYHGSPSPVQIEDEFSGDARVVESSSGSRFGSSVAAGDVNGDGFSDLLVGAPQASSGEGKASIFYGSGRTGRSVRAQQVRGDGSGVPVQRHGDAVDGDGFIVRITGSHPAGRGRVKAEAQACPAAIAFGGPGCVSAISPAWLPVTPATPNADMSLALAGLPPATRIHWRARVLRADTTEAAGVTPSRGPWRRRHAEVFRTDIRTSSDVDLDTVADSVDNCRYRANPLQEDAGAFGPASASDGIGDICQCGNVAGGGRVDAVDVLAYRQSLADPGAAFGTGAISRCVVFGGGSACNVLQVSALRRGLAIPPLAPVTSSSAAQVCAASLP